MSFSRVKKIGFVGAVAAGLLATAAVPAQAGAYRWQYYATYPTQKQCEQFGTELVLTSGADVYRCSGPLRTELYLGYVW